MVYITLDELKEILPEILDQWIDKDDEGWEWIFNEIEQKCHIGAKYKGKKKKKHIENDISALKEYVDIYKEDICDLNDWYKELNKKVDELNNKVSNLSSSNVSMNSKINTLSNDIKAAKSMAQTAKQRTDVDYTKCSKEKSDADVEHDTLQEVYDRMVGRGATKEELDGFIDLINKYDALEKKEIPVVKKMCVTCKYFRSKAKFDNYPCNACNGNDKWEAKDE